jgi:hypothetical protein
MIMTNKKHWHGDIQGLPNNYTSDHLQMLLFNYLSPQSTECVFLFDDMTFKRGTVVDGSPQKNEPVWNNDGCDGSWRLHGQSVKLRQSEETNEELLEFAKDLGCFIVTYGHTRSFFYPIDSTELKQMAILFLNKSSVDYTIEIL